jgi:hypothetical protein
MKDRHGADEIDTSFITNPDVHREESDVNIRPILWFGVWLMIATVVIYFIIAGLYMYFEEREASQDLVRTPLAEERKRVPDEPRLQLAPTGPGQKQPGFIQDHPLTDMRDLREKEDAALNQYGWVDQQNGVVRIPIEDAIKLALQQSRQYLPSKPGSQTQTPTPGTIQATRGGTNDVTTGATPASEKTKQHDH